MYNGYKAGELVMNNIKKLRTRAKIKQIDLCAQLGITQGALSGWENGRYEPDIKSLRKMAAIFNTTVDYLLGNDTPEREKGVRIPVIGNSAAGLPIDAIQEYIDDNDPDSWEEISESMAATGDYVAIKIKGDSMEPRIMEGDIIIVRLQNDVDSGDTAIVLVNGDEATCKKIKKRPEGVMLISNNSDYEPMFYSNKDIQTLPVRIYGKVVEVRGKL